ncbi:MAG TPA: thioredoxin-dependent thiol peroxidase [Bacteroidales bacterium]|nr:thioredoxin-dependent thiol peroxidase [Bacteroidales bacterium]HPR58137.1 thioredoxin-dependent thiol peroxidase [Bacteroidales bacterium]HRW96792.1 thioredoxin-dependent thiol peroxidase [Bacteroidales bacterium]
MTELQIGKKAPAFKTLDHTGKSISLTDFSGKKVILYFYPKANTPGCTAEACNLRDNYDDLMNKGYKIIGVSADTTENQKKFAEKFNLPFPLIPDTEKEIIKAYGAWGEKKMYGKSYEGILRKTFVIDEKGMIEKVIENVKTKDHAAQILQAMNN